ncbi:hypothetical protein [Polaribacter sp.]|uniref:hypothetical protein n=1 Tax=Polaribacter sp. TaxID=1920175 RepID=UPI003F6A8797
MKKLIICLLLVVSACATSKNTTKKDVKITTIENISFSGGDGSSFKNSVIVNAKNSREGIAAEYKYLAKKYGRRGVDWQMIKQTLSYNDKKPFDVLSINYNSKKMEVYFEISSFFGKY